MTNEVFANSVQTLQISTGNVATVNDAYDSTNLSYPLNNGAKNPIGQAAYVSDGTTTGRRWKVRYVRLNSTATPTLIVGPVYWKDNTFQVVTAVESEALFGLNSICGMLLNKNATNGNYVFILVAGHLAGVVAPASTAAGDAMVATAGNQLMTRTASGTAPVSKVVAWAETAITNYLSDMLVCAEDGGGI